MRDRICRRAFLLILLVAVAATAEETENPVPEVEESPAIYNEEFVASPVSTVAVQEAEDQSPNAETVAQSAPFKQSGSAPDYNYQPTTATRTIQKRSISNIIKLLLGGNVPPNHPLVKSNDIEQKTWSLATNIASSLAGHGHTGWGPSAASQISQLFATKARILPYTGQVASGLTGIAAVKGDILKQIHSLSTAVIAQAAAEAAAKAVASAAAAHAVTAGVANGIHQTKYAVNKAVKHAKAQVRPGGHGFGHGYGGVGGGWNNNYQQAYYSTFQNAYAPAPAAKTPGDLPGPPYGGGNSAVASPQVSPFHISQLGGLNSYLNEAASNTHPQSQSAPSQSGNYFQQNRFQQQQPQAYDLYSSFGNNNNNNADNPESRSEQYNTLPSYQQGDQQQQQQQNQWNGLFGQQQQKPGSSIFNMFQGGLGSTKVQGYMNVSSSSRLKPSPLTTPPTTTNQPNTDKTTLSQRQLTKITIRLLDTQNMSVPLTPERLSGLRNFPLFLSAASASVSGRNVPEPTPSILTSLATLLSASASAYQAINKISDASGSPGVPIDPTARQDSSVPTAAATATSTFPGFPTSSTYQQQGQAATASSRGFPQGVSSTRYQPGRSSPQSQSQAQGSVSSGSSAVPTYAMAPQFAPNNFNQQTRPSTFNSPSSSFGPRPSSNNAYQHNAQASRDSQYAESVPRTQGGFPGSGGYQQQQSNNGQGYSGYPRGTGQSYGHANGPNSFPTNYWGNGGVNTISSRNFQTVSGNSGQATGNFASPSGTFAASQQSPKQVYGFGGQAPQNFAQPGIQRNYQSSPIQNYAASGRPTPNQGYGGHPNQPLNSFINSRYNFIAQSSSPDQINRRYELSAQPPQSQFNSHQQYNSGMNNNNNRMPVFHSKPGGGFTIPMANEPISFTLNIPNNGRPATILQERKGLFASSSPKSPEVSEHRLSSEEGGNAGEASSVSSASYENTNVSGEKFQARPFSKESNSWEETRAEKKSSHATRKEKMDYIYSKEVAESNEYNGDRKEETSREINMSNSHEAVTSPKKSPRLSPDDLRSLLVDEEETESRGRDTQTSSGVSSADEEPAKKVSSSNKKPKKDWDTLRREERARSLSALVQRLMGVQD